MSKIGLVALCVLALIGAGVSVYVLALNINAQICSTAPDVPPDPNTPPIESVLMQPSDEWNSVYADVPAKERRLYWTVRTLTQVAIAQQKRIQALEDPNHAVQR